MDNLATLAISSDRKRGAGTLRFGFLDELHTLVSFEILTASAGGHTETKFSLPARLPPAQYSASVAG